MAKVERRIAITSYLCTHVTSFILFYDLKYERILASLRSPAFNVNEVRDVYRNGVLVCLRVLNSGILESSECVCMRVCSVEWYVCARICRDATASCMIIYICFPFE
jgi:hypothetical protein